MLRTAEVIGGVDFIAFTEDGVVLLIQALMILEPGMLSERLASILMRLSATRWTVVDNTNVAMQGLGHNIWSGRDLGIPCTTYCDAHQLISFMQHTFPVISTSISAPANLESKVMIFLKHSFA